MVNVCVDVVCAASQLGKLESEGVFSISRHVSLARDKAVGVVYSDIK